MLRASRCRNQHTFVPNRKICPKCRRATEEVEISCRGIILTFTTLNVPPKGFKGPIIMALVKLEEGEVVFCKYNEKEENKLKIGAKVAIEVDTCGLYQFKLLC
ncbi:Zn-ribbon domain-containing OB-fold protein [Candidatus Riflebacteria bacterium]